MGSRSSTTDDPSALPRTVLVGVVRRPHGVRGEVTVEPQTDRRDRFEPGSELTWVRASATAERTLRVSEARPHRGAWLVRFEGVDDRDAAQALAGGQLEAEPVEEAPEDGVFYHYQLLGCRCRDRAHGELGTVVDVVEDGGGEILAIQGPPGEDGRRTSLLVPFVGGFLERVDVEAREIDFDLPEGLVEACTSTS